MVLAIAAADSTTASPAPCAMMGAARVKVPEVEMDIVPLVLSPL